MTETQTFDLSSVNLTVARRFRLRHKVFTAVGATTLPALIAVAVWAGFFLPADPGYRALLAVWALILAWYGGAFGFGLARQIEPGPSRLGIGNRGVSLVLNDGRTRFFPWTGQHVRFRMRSMGSRVDGLPDYSLLIRPRFVDLFPPYRGFLPITPMTREAFEALLEATKNHGAIIFSEPSSRFLGIEAPGLAYIFELGTAATP
jgi:hypothetical protein